MAYRPLNAAARDRLRRRMLAIPEHIKAAARDVLMEGAETIASQARSAAPRDEGDLIASIEVEDHSGPDRVSVKVKAGGSRTLRQVRKGAKAVFDYARAAEFGTARQAAQPFFFPTYRRNKRAIRSRLRAAIKKAAQQP